MRRDLFFFLHILHQEEDFAEDVFEDEQDLFFLLCICSSSSATLFQTEM
jgi:hypothetical protein